MEQKVFAPRAYYEIKTISIRFSYIILNSFSVETKTLKCNFRFFLLICECC